MDCKREGCNEPVTGKSQYCSGACRTRASRASVTVSPIADGAGFVYIIQSGDSNYYKIGCTVNRPLARVRELQTGSPVELKLFEVFHSDDMVALEQDAQSKVKASRVRGEWFELTMLEVERLAAYLARDTAYFYYDKDDQEQARQSHRRISSELADYEYNDVLPEAARPAPVHEPVASGLGLALVELRRQLHRQEASQA